MSEHNPTQNRQIQASTALIAWASYRLKVGSVADDLFARARVIESALGLPQWSLSGNPRAFLSEGPAQAPNADADWFSTRDQKIRESLLKGVQGVLGNSPQVEEVVQDMTSGFGGAARNDVYGYLGKKSAAQVLGGSLGVRQAKAMLAQLAKRRALDVMKKDQGRKEVGLMMDTEDSAFDISAPSVYQQWQEDSSLNQFELVLLMLRGRNGKNFENWILQSARRILSPIQEKILQIDLESYRTGRSPYGPTVEKGLVPAKTLASHPDVYSLSRAGQPLTDRAINKQRAVYRSHLLKLIEDGLKGDPKVQAWADQIYMTRRASKTSVADKWLQAPRS